MFLGLPITLVLFTILMMLYLNNHVIITISFLYSFHFLSPISIMSFISIWCWFFLFLVCLGYTFVLTPKKSCILLSQLYSSSPMWFLSHFNSNLIFNLMKSDYVTRTKRESQSSAKFISNNEVVFTDNAHYHLLLCQILVVYFGIFANLYLFNLFQTGMTNRSLIIS